MLPQNPREFPSAMLRCLVTFLRLIPTPQQYLVASFMHIQLFLHAAGWQVPKSSQWRAKSFIGRLAIIPVVAICASQKVVPGEAREALGHHALELHKASIAAPSLQHAEQYSRLTACTLSCLADAKNHTLGVLVPDPATSIASCDVRS